MNKIEIHKKYLSTNMCESELIILLDKIQDKNIKDNGVVYTPWHIVQKMIEISNPSIKTTIIEPSCGHGVFLFGLLNYILKKYKLTGKQLLFWFRTKLTAIDLSEDSIKDLKEILSLYFYKHFNIDIKSEDFYNIKNEDALYYKNKILYDLCIGNPPYVRTRNLDKEYLKLLREKFKSCEKGNIDLYYAFIERFSIISNNLCLITPNSFLTNFSGKKVRGIVFNGITHLLDFKDQIIFDDVRTYTCIFKTSKIQSSDFLYSNDINKDFVLKNKKDFISDNNNVELKSNVLSGLATLCDSVYIVNKKNNRFYAYYENNEYEIEKEMIAPYLKLSKIKNKDLTNINYMIYPYDNNKKIISENIIKDKYPLTYKYLLIVKSKLLQRDKGKTDKYENWYAYGRKQGLHTINTNEVIVIPQMIRSDCRPILLSIKDLLKDFNKIVFTSGYLIPNTIKEETQAILSDDFIEFAKSNGKAWPGKNEPYYSLTIKQIRQFKVTE